MLPGVRESAQFIASTASHVSIEEDGVHRAAEMVRTPVPGTYSTEC